MPRLFHHTLTRSAELNPQAVALRLKQRSLSYAELNEQIHAVALSFLGLGLAPEQRVAIYLPKQFEAITSFYATSTAGGIFVPVNPLLKGPQIKYILQDCDVSFLVTSLSRYQQMQEHFDGVDSIKTIILTDCTPEQTPAHCFCWLDMITAQRQQAVVFPNRISEDIAAILYTSGSTGAPKGVVLSHGNLVSGAKSVVEYLGNRSNDRLLAVLPFSFDYGLSQMTTAFSSGATLVLMEYLFPKDVIRAVEEYQITGLAAVPPLWVQLAELEWPENARRPLRYITNSGGAMPQATLALLRKKLPTTQPFLMYGLTEAFRSTYLDPSEITTRPTSMGKAIPDAEILVVDEQGNECKSGEEGELVHRGPHVAKGYWNSPEKTAERFKPLSTKVATGLTPEIAVWSGDTVIKDDEGFLYFVGRKDDMIKSSGYRISPSEVEDCLYHHDSIAEVAAIGVPHMQLGQAVVIVLKALDSKTFDEKAVLKYCQKQLPNFMQPKALKLLPKLPRNANGKIDRPRLQKEFVDLFKPSTE